MPTNKEALESLGIDIDAKRLTEVYGKLIEVFPKPADGILALTLIISMLLKRATSMSKQEAVAFLSTIYDSIDDTVQKMPVEVV